MASLRPLLRLVLVIGLVLSTQSLLLIQGAFVLRQDYIADTLCVNRDRPELECDGHCVLMERLGTHHEHQDESGTDALALALSVVPLVASGTALAPPTSTPPPSFGIVPREGTPAGHPADVFRPPQGA